MNTPDIPVASVGLTVPRADAVSKVTGRERYASDGPGRACLWAGVKRAGVPHARLEGIDCDKARSIPGVRGILTHRDVRGSNRQGVVEKDQPVLVDDVIRHTGDAVALVVGETRKAVSEAIELISIRSQVLPGIFSIDDALSPDAPVIHPSHPDGNCLLKGEIITGEGEKAFSGCAAVVDITVDLPRQEHAYLETESGYACFEDGNLVVTASTQTPFRDRAETAHALGLDPACVRVKAPYLGGGFGGKDGITVQSLLGLAAMAFPGETVRMTWDREESFLAGSKRHGGRVSCRLGADSQGRLHALNVDVDIDTGPYDHLGGVVLALAMEHAGGPYRIPNALIRGRAVYTNNTIGGAFRGFGVPQVLAATEQAMDMMANALGVSPAALRQQHAVCRGDRLPSGVTLQTSVGFSTCLEKVKAHSLYTQKEVWKAEADPRKLRGVGMSAAMHGMGFGPVVPDTAGAKLELTPEGRFRIYCGVADMGQGNASTFLQIAGDLLNQDSAHLELVLPDTKKTLPSGSSSASRTTSTFAGALLKAAGTMKERLFRRAADGFMVLDENEFVLVPGSLRHLPTGRDLPLEAVAGMLDTAERMVAERFRAPVNREMPVKDPALKMRGIPHLIFSFGVHLAGVEIDCLTGTVTVLDYLAATDCGRLINPGLYRQQMHGGIVQGIGYALYEDLISNSGTLLTDDFSTYILPGAPDVPAMTLLTVESDEHQGPFGMKGVGEIAIDAPLPAIANAVADACGRRPSVWPLSPERMLELLNDGAPYGEN